MSDSASKQLEQAISARKRWWSFGTDKYEEAAEHYETASNLFRSNGQLKEAGQAAIESATMYLRVPQKSEAATMYIKAATLFQSIEPTKSIELLTAVIELYAGMGKFKMMTHQYETIATLYEEMLDFDRAIENYRSAAEIHEVERNTRPLQKCLVKMAELLISKEQYTEAIEIYQRVIASQTSHGIEKWNLPGTLLRTGLCYLANQDIIGLKRAHLSWRELSPIFGNSRECRLLTSIIEIMEDSNVPQSSDNTAISHFTELCREYDELSAMDPMTVTLLLRIKKTLHADLC